MNFVSRKAVSAVRRKWTEAPNPASTGFRPTFQRR